jgi:hypothetical protein
MITHSGKLHADGKLKRKTITINDLASWTSKPDGCHESDWTPEALFAMLTLRCWR